jgi:membrane associated rhomboid family serine protease
LIPLRDDNPTEITPFMTFVFILMNIGAWLMLQGAGAEEQLMASVLALGSVPCEITGACEREGLGWSTVFTSMFLHGSWGHLLGNMLFLWVFGNNIEDSMGHMRFIAFYLLTGVSAALAHIYLNPASAIPAVGASGAISGVMGAYILLYPRVRVHTYFPPIFFLRLPAVLILGYWFTIQLAMGVVTFGPEAGTTGGVAVWAHVGGFVAGLLLIKVFEKPALTTAKRNKIQLSREEARRLQW